MFSTLLLSLYSMALTSFYSLQFQDVNGATISMNSFQGKKVLIVNIATGCGKVDQLHGLRQLQAQHQDSLVVIAFPSNSFEHESRSNAEIKAFCQSIYQSNFIIASKAPVTGTGIQPVFNWLALQSENGKLDAPAAGDYHKFLISKTGELVSVLSPVLTPLDPDVVEAITNNN